MLLTISFNELSTFISGQTGKRVTFTDVDEKTVKATMTMKVLMFEKGVSATLTVEGINNGAILLSYDVPAILAKGIKPGLSLLENAKPEIADAIELRSDDRVLVSLWKIPQLTKALEYIDLKSLRFTSTGIELEADLK